MATNFEKLQKLLEELFQLDQADLDFGIYRIMNQKRDEVVRFLEKDLLPQVKEAFSHYQSADKATLQKELDKLVTQVEGAGMNPDDSPKVQELKAQMADSSVDVTALENEVFSHLFNFFRRYYHEGDFLSLRRYKEGVYAIPYEGEEVKLHWANHDQYYVKSSEYFRDYIFTMPSGKRVRVHLVAASSEQDNKKEQAGKERRFVICAEDPIYEEDGELFIRFEYKSENGKKKQDALNQEAIERVLSTEGFDEWTTELAKPAPTEKNKNRTVLEKHLKQYTARNTFDYFIHKDLGGFLRRELDFYIKNEVMHLDDIEHDTVPRVEQYLSKIKVIRKIAHKIIQFLEQLENFQKKLWLKKKFVVETNYCITLDRVPEELYPEIAANDAQREEWVRLFAIDEIEEDHKQPGYSKPLTVEFLKDNPFLVLDTCFFSSTFKQAVVSSCGELDAELDGVLFNSDNFHALALIHKRFKNRITHIYIDPPYNTDSTPIVYKNGYRDSSWITLMRDRIALSMQLLNYGGVKTIAIDDTEMVNLSMMLNDVAPTYRMSRLTVIHNPKGSITKDFNRVHEYALFLTPEEAKTCIARTLEENTTPRKMRRWGENSLRTDRRLSFYPIYVNDGNIVRIGTVPDDSFHPEGRNVELETGEIEIWPIDQNGIERRWNFGLDSIEKNLDRIVIQEVDGTLDLFLSHEETVPKTVWSGGDFDAGNYGNTLLINMLGEKRFDFPKSIRLMEKCVSLVNSLPDHEHIVLDYFGGSGTTGHAVINCNRTAEERKKFILVEMGAYFETVTKPRLLKAIYSDTWSGGKPVSRSGIGSSVKYIRLESYEDALNNLKPLKPTTQQASLLEQDDDLREQYVLSYMLDVESRGSQSLLNVESFRNPDEYKLRVERDGETQLVNVDLVETFNWLLGLTVKHIDVIRGVRVVEGTNPDGDRAIVLWRNLDETNNDALDEWFKKQKYNTKDQEYDLIYVNGDNNLENLRRGDQTWKVRLIEEEFGRLMFDVEDV